MLNSDANNYKLNDMPKGWMNQSALNMRIYYMWKAMIERTTPKYWKQYPTYEGTTVDDSWRKLSSFVNDIQMIPGYDAWVNSPNQRMMLDKDTLIDGNKHYGKNTCCFVTHAKSNQDVAKRHPENIQKARQAYAQSHSMPVRLTNINTKEIVDYQSLKEASRESGLTYEQIRRAFHSDNLDKKVVRDWLITNPFITIQN